MLSGKNLIENKLQTMVTFFSDGVYKVIDRELFIDITRRVSLYIIHGYTSGVDKVLGEHTKQNEIVSWPRKIQDTTSDGYTT